MPRAKVNRYEVRIVVKRNGITVSIVPCTMYLMVQNRECSVLYGIGKT